jgi:hypothetical protein
MPIQTSAASGSLRSRATPRPTASTAGSALVHCRHAYAAKPTPISPPSASRSSTPSARNTPATARRPAVPQASRSPRSPSVRAARATTWPHPATAAVKNTNHAAPPPKMLVGAARPMPPATAGSTMAPPRRPHSTRRAVSPAGVALGIGRTLPHRRRTTQRGRGAGEGRRRGTPRAPVLAAPSTLPAILPSCYRSSTPVIVAASPNAPTSGLATMN